MDIKAIKQIAQIMREYEITLIEYGEGDMRLKLERGARTQLAPPAQPQETPQVQTAPSAETEKNAGLDFNDVEAVASPMVGVFYQSPAPGEQPYVQIGSIVKAGEVLCLVEAMKLMNEITAPRDGKIVDICVSDGDVVEFGQTLFKIF